MFLKNTLYDIHRWRDKFYNDIWIGELIRHIWPANLKSKLDLD